MAHLFKFGFVSGDKTWRALEFGGQISKPGWRAFSETKNGELHLPCLRRVH